MPVIGGPPPPDDTVRSDEVRQIIVSPTDPGPPDDPTQRAIWVRVPS